MPQIMTITELTRYIKKIIVSAIVTLRYGGLKSLLRSIYTFLFFKADFYFYKKDLRNPAMEQDFNVPRDLVIRKFSPSEVRDIRKGLTLSQNEFFRYEIDNPDSCYVAFSNGSLAHVSWVYSCSDGIIPLKPGEVEIKACFTFPLYRGRSIYPAVLNEISKDLERKGVSWVYLKIHPNNKASIHGAEKAGFRKCAVAKAQRSLLTGKIWCQLSTA